MRREIDMGWGMRSGMWLAMAGAVILPSFNDAGSPMFAVGLACFCGGLLGMSIAPKSKPPAS